MYNNLYIDPVIIVGIETRNRHFEFLPKHKNTAKEGNYPAAGGADTLALSLENEVLPLINERFRTNGYNIGIGHSLGGTFTTYCLLRYPNLFDAVISVSPNYTFDNEQIASIASEANISESLSHKFLYVSYGHSDSTEEKFKPSTLKLDSIMKEIKTSNFFYKIQGLDNDSHATTPMEGIFKGLVLLNRQFSFDDKERDYSFGKIKSYFDTINRKSNVKVPAIGEVNVLAYNAFYRQKEDAIKIMEWGLSMYPDDSNLLDSMGELQAKAGNKEKARHYYKSALSVIDSQERLLEKSNFLDKRKWFIERINSLDKK